MVNKRGSKYKTTWLDPPAGGLQGKNLPLGPISPNPFTCLYWNTTWVSSVLILLNTYSFKNIQQGDTEVKPLNSF